MAIIRRQLIAANWKENKTAGEASGFIGELAEIFRGKPGSIEGKEVLICPSFVSLESARRSAEGSPIKIGAQNMFYEDSGAYSGEISPLMLKDFCEYVILGHSERRKYFNETDEAINKKVHKAIEHGLKIVLCIGESLAERQSRRAEEVLRKQLSICLDGIEKDAMKYVVIAYEPIWAISGGDASKEPATPETAEETHAFIRAYLESLYGEEVSASARIIYGGSVKPSNIAGFMAKDDIDGALVGGASLDVYSFFGIINY